MNKAYSDQLLTLLRDRVKDQTRQEILSYLDDLLPPYTLPDYESKKLDDRKLVYHVTDFLDYFGEEFVEISYLCLLKRPVDSSGLESGLQSLKLGNCSRVELLGRLKKSEEGVQYGVKVEGLWFWYFLARLRKVPLLGRVVGFVVNFNNLLRLDLSLETLNADIVRSRRTVDAAQHAISDQYSELVKRLESSEGELANGFLFRESTDGVRGDGPVLLSQLTSLSGEQFVRSIYLAVFKREPSNAEIVAAMNHLTFGHKSKIMLLGDLYRSAEAAGNLDDIGGLRIAYRSEKLLSIPLIGCFLQLPRAFRMLSRVDAVLEYQGGEIAGCMSRMSKMEVRLMSHYNKSLIHLKRELVEALKEHNVPK